MEEANKEERDLLKERYSIEKWLLINITIAFCSLVILGERFIIGYNPPLNVIEYIALPVNIEMFLIPLMLILYIVIIIKCQLKRIHVKFTKKRILGIAAALIMSSYFIWFINGMRGSGVITDVKKYEDGNKYYIYCGDIKLRCTQNEYNLVLGDKKYSIQYSYNKLLPGKGHLELINVLEK